jgi:hypothetical protein
MKLVEILHTAADAERAAANVAYHLAAGVDLVLVSRAGLGEGVEAVLEPYLRDGRAALADGDASALARLAAREHGADWVLVADAGEFWWPRGESLQDPLAAMPGRYGVVQALVREFRRADGDGSFAERMVRRPTLQGTPPRPLRESLRPLFRADPELVVEPEAPRSRVPLRAWYPYEVLRFATDGEPERDSDVVDTRLRDALRELEAGGGITFAVPDLVDDAAYAAECAAVGEVDLPRLEREVSELERRVATLEQRLWPSVVRRLGRLRRR